LKFTPPALFQSDKFIGQPDGYLPSSGVALGRLADIEIGARKEVKLIASGGDYFYSATCAFSGLL
jgi:hypothetical protein